MVIVVFRYSDSSIYTYHVSPSFNPKNAEDYVLNTLGFKESEIIWMIGNKIALFENDEFRAYL